MNRRNLVLSILIGSLMLLTPLTAFTAGAIQPNASDVSGTAQNSLAFIPHKGISNTQLGLFNGAVNPYAFYSSEAAPMGVADYGVGPNNTPYYYTTNEFLGQIQLDKLSVNGPNGQSMSFQLNVNLQFTLNNGNTYTYWIQDVAFVDTSLGQSAGYIQFIDNVWNSSSVNAQMLSSSLAGNGTVSSSGSTGFYYDWASALPGNDYTLNYPSTVQMEVISYTTYYNGNYVPAVAFLYNDGFGWQTYDNVYFTFASSLSYDSGFVVDGYNYNPAGLFNDAELIMGGPGGGSTTTDTGSLVNLTLEYYNYFNFQQITNAYDFGSDTAETISNIVDQAYYYGSSTGQLFNSITSGSGNLNNSYQSSDVSWMTIVSNIYSGYLYINNYNVTQFTFGYVNVTLGPGTYSFSLFDPYTDSFTSIPSQTLTAGNGVTYYYNANMVNFTSFGLPVGTLWSVTLNNVTESSTSSTITFYTIPGQFYSYSVSTPAHYYTTYSTGSGNFTGTSSEQFIYIYWNPITYYFNFTESGLPTGTVWSVTLNHTSQSTSGDTIQFTETAGNASFRIINVTGYTVYPNSGDIYLNSNITLDLFFVPNANSNVGNVTNTIMLNSGKTYNGEYFPYTGTTDFLLQDAYDPVNGYLYVASALNSNITIINTNNNKVVGNISLPQKYMPEYLLYDAANNQLYASTPTGTVLMLSTQTNSLLGTVNIGNRQFIDYLSLDSQDGNIIVSANGNITVMSQNGYIIKQIYTGASSFVTAAIYDPATNSIVATYYDQSGQSMLASYNATNFVLNSQFSLKNSPDVFSMLYDKYDNGMYLFASSNIIELNATTLNAQSTILLSGESYWGTIVPFTHDIYVLDVPYNIADSYSNISVVNPSTGTITNNIPLPFGSLFSAYVPSSQEIYVTNAYTNSVYVFQPEHFYNVNLTVKNLPAGTKWYINMTGGNSYSSTGKYISFYEPNGQYSYTVSTSNKTWEPATPSNSIIVNGASDNVVINWNEVLFSVTFHETGLGNSTSWYVIVDGQNISGISGSNITVQLPNGTYDFLVGKIGGYNLTSGSGSFTIHGAGVNESSTFSKITPPKITPPTTSPANNNTILYAAVGAVAVVGAIGAVAVLRKRK